MIYIGFILFFILVICCLASWNSKKDQERMYISTNRPCANQEEYLLCWEYFLEFIQDPAHTTPIRDAEFAAAQKIHDMGYSPWRVPNGVGFYKLEDYYTEEAFRNKIYIEGHGKSKIESYFYVTFHMGLKGQGYFDKESLYNNPVVDTREFVLKYRVPPTKKTLLDMRDMDNGNDIFRKFKEHTFGFHCSDLVWKQYCDRQDERFHNICVKYNKMKREQHDKQYQRKLQKKKKAHSKKKSSAE